MFQEASKRHQASAFLWDNWQDETIIETVVIFFNYTIQRIHSQHTYTLTPMNTHTQIILLWARPNDWAPIDLEIPEVTVPRRRRERRLPLNA
jgi:hypothetical protein